MKITQTGTYIPISAPTAPYLERFTTDKPPVSGSKTPHHIPCGRYTATEAKPCPLPAREQNARYQDLRRGFSGNHPLRTRSRCWKTSRIPRTKRTRRRRKVSKAPAPPHADGKRCGGDAEHEKHPPRTRTEPILRLDDERMEKPDDKKRKDADRQSGQTIFRKKGDDSLHFTQTLIPAAQQSGPVPH